MNRRPLSLVLCLLVPGVILAVGLGFAGVQGWKAFRDLMVENGRGLLPPGFTVEITEPGKHTLWLHTYTVLDGTAYESGERLPGGARILLTWEGSGETIHLNPWLAARKSVGSETAVSVGTFEATAPGRVSVVGTGLSRPVVLSIAPAKMGQVFRTLLQVGGIAVVSLLMALVTLIVLLHRRQRAMQAEARLHSGDPSPREH